MKILKTIITVLSTTTLTFALPQAAAAETDMVETIKELRAEFRKTPTDYKPPGLTVAEQFIMPTDFKSPGASCAKAVDFEQSKLPIVALGKPDMKDVEFKSPMCGSCVQIEGPNGTVTATVTSMCGEEQCVPGTIQLNRDIALRINGGNIDQKFKAKWSFTDCPADDADLKDGESPAPEPAPEPAPPAPEKTCYGKDIVNHPELELPGNSTVLFKLTASGFQVYRCSAGGWSLFDASATLYADCADKKTVVTHGFLMPGKATPVFYDIDTYSGFQGAIDGKVNEEGTIPSLRLKMENSYPRTGGEPGKYNMEPVRWVKRLASQGGVAPSNETCTAEKEGALQPVPFKALYIFYD
jgi:hypothetical protein